MKKWKKFDKSKKVFIGIFVGIINGFFGSGGGIIGVQSMEMLGIEEKKSHATSILAILPLSIASGIMYYLGGDIPFEMSTWFLLGGACIGGLAGAFLLGKLQGNWVNGIFTLLIIASGIRMVF